MVLTLFRNLIVHENEMIISFVNFLQNHAKTGNQPEELNSFDDDSLARFVGVS